MKPWPYPRSIAHRGGGTPAQPLFSSFEPASLAAPERLHGALTTSIAGDWEYWSEYLIGDESDLLDFTEMGSSDTSEIWIRITEVYGVSLADVESERRVNVFAEITRRRNVQ